MSTEERLYAQERERLVQILRDRGIDHEGVLKAIGAVPRHEFVDPALRRRAYDDEALPIGRNQTISQPYTVAYQTMLLDPEPEDRVLEVGTGSGYQAAILCEMGVRVFSIERHKPLLDRATDILSRLGYRVVSRHGDGTRGWRAFAPYDGIVVTAGAREIPSPLLEQLRIPDEQHRPGRLVIPVGSRASQTMTKVLRLAPDEYEKEEHPQFRFVPLVEGTEDNS